MKAQEASQAAQSHELSPAPLPLDNFGEFEIAVSFGIPHRHCHARHSLLIRSATLGVNQSANEPSHREDSATRDSRAEDGEDEL